MTPKHLLIELKKDLFFLKTGPLIAILRNRFQSQKQAFFWRFSGHASVQH